MTRTYPRNLHWDDPHLMVNLRRNDPTRTHVSIGPQIGHDAEGVARALEINRYVTDITLSHLRLPKWGPVLKVISERRGLETVSLEDCSFRDFTTTAEQLEPFLKAIEANRSIQTVRFLRVGNLTYEILSSVLRRAPHVSSLLLFSCTELEGGSMSAEAVLPSSVKRLELAGSAFATSWSYPVDLMRSNPPLQELAIGDGACEGDYSTGGASISRFLSTTTSLRRLQLGCGRRKIPEGVAAAVMASKSITEVVFAGNDGHNDPRLIDILRNKRNLKCLGLHDWPRTISARCLDAFISRLLQSDNPPLQALEIRCCQEEGASFPDRGQFGRLLQVIAQSTLKRFCIFGIGSILVPSLTNFLATTRLCELEFSIRDDFCGCTNLLLSEFKRNYSLRSVEAKLQVHGSFDSYFRITNELFGREDRQTLQMCLERNSKLAGWVKDPSSVPNCLWAEALKVALDAEHEELFRTMLLEKVAQSLEASG